MEKVYDFYREVANWPTLAPPGLRWAWKDVDTTPELTGSTLSYTGKLGGVVDLAGTIEILAAVPNERIVLRDSGPVGPGQTETYLFESVGTGMTLTVVNEREGTRAERIPLVGSVAQRVVTVLTTQWMRVLKRRMEEQP